MTASQKWDKRVGQWHGHVISAAAFGKVLDRILDLSQPQPSDVCVDLGAGTGFVTTALAPLVASVRAVDISPAMTEALAGRTADAGLANVSTEVTDLVDADAGQAPADGEFRQRYLAENQRLGQQGLRVIATARKDFDPAAFDPGADLLGLVTGLELPKVTGAEAESRIPHLPRRPSRSHQAPAE